MIVVSLIEELRHRGYVFIFCSSMVMGSCLYKSFNILYLDIFFWYSGLHIALSGRDESSLEPLLNFLIRHCINPRFAAVLLDVCTLLFGMLSILKNRETKKESEVTDQVFP